MMFCAKNEEGISAWKLVLNGQKTVTRRIKPMTIGKIFGVQPRRMAKSVCWCRVISCVKNIEWRKILDNCDPFKIENRLQNEAYLEGFQTWDGLVNWLNKHGRDVDRLYRIKFVKIKDGEK